MKRSLFFALAIFAIAISVSWFYVHNRSEKIVPSTTVFRDRATSKLSSPGSRPTEYQQISTREMTKEEIGAEVSRRDRIDSKWEWKIPIKFYGKTVDEKGQPVAGVDVHFQWTDLSAKGTSVADSESDARGLFSLENVEGKSLLVRLAKPGYYTNDARNRLSFEYANPYEESFYQPYPDAPVIFYLRKQKPSPDVISRSIEVMLQGAATVRIGLDTGKPSPKGELAIETSKPWPPRPMSPSYDWQVGFHIENGGFVETPEQFAFEAPESGYQPNYTVDMRAALGSGWKVNVERTLYFVFGTPRKYGRLTFRTDGNSRYIFLDYVINNSGSRDLEAAPPS